MINYVNHFNIRGLVKVGINEHIERLLRYGEIYLNTVEFYRNQDLAKGVSDNFEGCDHIDRKNRLWIEDEGKIIELPDVKEIAINNKDTYNGNIFCTYAVESDKIIRYKNRNIIDLTKFGVNNHGGSVLMVNQPQEFVKRVEIECGKLGYDLWFGLVDYFEDDYTGEINVFKKRNKYKYQNEARFYIPNLDNKPIILQVGSIEDIANIIHFEQSDITKEELEKIRYE